MRKAKPYKPANRETFVKAVIRRASRNWPAAGESKRRARVAPNREQCAMCAVIVKISDRMTNLDHIIPVMGLKQETRLSDGKMDWNAYIERCLPEVEGYQVLCIPCHDAKTLTENEFRSKFKKKNKKKLKNERQVN